VITAGVADGAVEDELVDDWGEVVGVLVVEVVLLVLDVGAKLLTVLVGVDDTVATVAAAAGALTVAACDTGVDAVVFVVVGAVCAVVVDAVGVFEAGNAFALTVFVTEVATETGLCVAYTPAPTPTAIDARPINPTVRINRRFRR